jgi:L-ribulose-5-phosphate 3-epimerase
MTRENFFPHPNRREFVKQSALAGAAVALSAQAAPSSLRGPIMVFSKHLHWLNYDQAAQTAAEIGFQGLDVTVRKAGHVLPENVERDLPKIVAAAEKAGIKVVSLTTEIDDAKNPLQQTVLKTAAQLHIPFYRMAWLKYDDSLSIQDNLRRFHRQLKALAELNEKMGIRGAYQNHSGASLGSPVWDIAQLLNEIDSPWLGCQYDIRHAVVEGANAWPLALKLAAPHINTIDIKDFCWTKSNDKWQLENTPLGEGVVDFKKYLGLLEQLSVNKEVPICLHFEYPLGGADKGADKLTVAPEVVTQAMKKDLAFFKNLLQSI